MTGYGPLKLHVPEPAVRPGGAPDFSSVRIPRAGSVARPAVDADPEAIRDLAYSIIRVLNRDGEAVGPWAGLEMPLGQAVVETFGVACCDRELGRLRLLIDLSDKRLTVDAASRLMGAGRRQVYRLRRAFAADGPVALVSRKRGRESASA